jgi:hypothetical protein
VSLSHHEISLSKLNPILHSNSTRGEPDTPVLCPDNPDIRKLRIFIRILRMVKPSHIYRGGGWLKMFHAFILTDAASLFLSSSSLTPKGRFQPSKSTKTCKSLKKGHSLLRKLWGSIGFEVSHPFNFRQGYGRRPCKCSYRAAMTKASP